MRENLSKFCRYFSLLLLVLGIILTWLWLKQVFAKYVDGWAAIGFLIFAVPVLTAALLLGVLPSLILYVQHQEHRDFKSLLFSSGTFLVLVVEIIFLLNFPPVQIMSEPGTSSAGTWENDAQNWQRAFKTNAAPEVTVIHSKYWKSDHFTEEFIWFFEINATPAWREEFLQSRGLKLLSTSESRTFRDNHKSAITPVWFAPDPVELYDVWGASQRGSVWINKTNGHLHFFGMQL